MFIALGLMSAVGVYAIKFFMAGRPIGAGGGEVRAEHARHRAGDAVGSFDAAARHLRRGGVRRFGRFVETGIVIRFPQSA